MTEEVWKNITGYEGIYDVSSLGKIRRIGSGRVLRDYANRNGYRVTTLHKKDKGKTHYIHSLVAQTFIKNNECCHTCGMRLEINHKDRNKDNNSVSNLEYITRIKNMEHLFSI